MTDRPNLLLFVLDDLRFDALGGTSGGAVRTPHADALIRRGCRFSRAQIQGGTCGAVCMPSRAVLHTGLGLFHLEDSGRTIPADHTLLGEHLRAHGYTAFGTGKWHQHPESFARSFSDGDDIFFGGMDDHWNMPVHAYDPAGRYADHLPTIRDPKLTRTVERRSGSHIHAGVHATDLFTDAALRFLKGHDAARPFFLSVALTAPHDPRSTHERFHRLYDPASIPLPPNFAPEHEADTGALRIRDERLAAIPRDPAEVREHIADYYAMITHLDEALGRTVGALEARGLLDRTLIVFTADHGLAVGQHGLMGKQNCYEHSVRVPLVFAGPDVPAGVTRETSTLHSDIFPTLCDLLGLPHPPDLHGTSLIPAFADAHFQPRDAVYMAYLDTVRAVRAGDLKLIEYATDTTRATQLFDLAADPWETRNLAADPAHADTLAAMREKLVSVRSEQGNPENPFELRFWARCAV